MPEDNTTTTTSTTSTGTIITPTVTVTQPEFAAITTQSDLDKVLGARLAREREKFADYADLKAKADAHDAAVEAAKTDAQKAVDAARTEGESAGRKAGYTQLVQAEARALAAEARFASPTHVVRSLDLSKVKVSDDGTVDVDAIKAELDRAKESGGFVIDGSTTSTTRPRPDHSQGGSGNPASGSSVAEVMAARRAAREAKSKP